MYVWAHHHRQHFLYAINRSSAVLVPQKSHTQRYQRSFHSCRLHTSRGSTSRTPRCRGREPWYCVRTQNPGLTRFFLLRVLQTFGMIAALSPLHHFVLLRSVGTVSNRPTAVGRTCEPVGRDERQKRSACCADRCWMLERCQTFTRPTRSYEWSRVRGGNVVTQT